MLDYGVILSIVFFYTEGKDQYMNARQIETFVNLSETLNFSETADALFLTQSSVSKLIKSMETELGLLLFYRENREVVLTESGQLLYKEMKDVLRKINQAILDAKIIAQEEMGKISIGFGGNAVEIILLSKLFTRVRESTTDVFFSIETIQRNEMKKMLLDSQKDLVFTRSIFIEDGSVDFVPIYKGTFACLMSKEHRLASKKAIELVDLNKERLFLLDPLESSRDINEIQERIKENCPEALICYVKSDQEALLMSTINNGIAIIPDFAVNETTETSIVRLNQPFQLEYGMAWRKNDNREIIREIIELIIENLPQI